MPVFIHDTDALDRLEQVEGAAWRQQRERDRASPYGFYAWLDAWKLKTSHADDADEPVSSFLEGGDGAIYGAGGYSRYIVTVAGELMLLRWSASPATLQLATAVGFAIR